ANHLDVFNRVNRDAGGYATEQRNFANSIRRDFLNFDGQSKTSGLVVAFDQPTLFQCRDMFRNRRLRANSKVARNLSIRRFVSVLREKASDVIENFFLSLSTWQHFEIK